MPASLDLPTLLPKVQDRLHQQQLHYYFPAVHASVDPDSSSHKMLLQKALHFPSVIIQNMRVHIRNHIDLSMTGITLYRLDVSTIQFQLISNAAMTETVKHNRWEIIVLNQFL